MAYQKHPSSSYARILFRHLRLSEENCDAYFDGTSVSYEALMTLDGTIPHADLAQIYRNALALSEREDLGLSVGAQLHLPAHGPLGVATVSGPDLRTGMTLLARLGQTRMAFFDITLSEHPDGMKVCFTETFDLSDLRVFVTESVLSGLFSAISFFTGVDEFQGRIDLAYPKPNYWQEYKSHFGRKLRFNRATTAIIIPEAALATPSPVADPAMYQEAVALCERQLKQIHAAEADRPAASAAAAVSNLIVSNPGRIWTLNEVAARLAMSPRTLIRKLAAEETRFQVIRDEIAKKQVADYLTDASLSVESVGHLMGFSDVSSFRRSFKRWFEETPSQYIARVRSSHD